VCQRVAAGAGAGAVVCGVRGRARRGCHDARLVRDPGGDRGGRSWVVDPGSLAAAPGAAGSALPPVPTQRRARRLPVALIDASDIVCRQVKHAATSAP
jgi:hypothetical protein